MRITIATAPTVEPVSTTELKEHLRLDSTTIANDLTSTQSIAPGSHAIAAAYALEGAGVDVLGKNAVVYLVSGTNGTGATVDCKIQESDDNSTYTDWTGGAFTQVTTANDNATQEKEYTGTKQYIRVVCTVATDACSFGVDIVTDEPTTSEDDLLTALISTTRRQAESILGRALITQTWNYYLDCFPDGDLEIPFPPLQSVTSITYTESDDTSAYGNTFSSTYYSVDTDSEPGRVVLNYGQSWASGTLATKNPIKVIFVGGYGATGSTIPEPITTWIKMAAAHLYENRESGDLSSFALGLLQPYRIWRW